MAAMRDFLSFTQDRSIGAFGPQPTFLATAENGSMEPNATHTAAEMNDRHVENSSPSTMGRRAYICAIF